MTDEQQTVVDFVAANEAEDEWKLVLVEEGPWKGPVAEELRRVQKRLYGCLDGALDGKVAEQFPGSKGKRIIIRLDCYNVPKAEVVEFFDRFSQGVLRAPDYREALRNSKVVRDVSFEINFDSVH